VCPVWLSEMASCLSQPGVALALGQVRFLKESFALSMAADYESKRAQYVWSNDSRRFWYAYTNNLAVRRNAFERCGPFPQIARGGDVVFAANVREEYGPGCVRYAPSALLRHLEIEGVTDWLRKASTYGRSGVGYGSLSRTRPLSFTERWAVMQQVIAGNSYSASRALSLAGLLAAGGMAYDFSRLWQTLRTARRP
jgi:hypothetical protein